MKPADYRNDTWDSLQLRVNHLRRMALEAWRAFGPGTTREVAERAKLDILSFRPRTTELCQLGFVVLDETAKARGHEGVYRALSDGEALAEFHARQLAARTADAAQPELKLPMPQSAQSAPVPAAA